MTRLSYILNPVEGGFTFQVIEQSADIDAFLANQNFLSKTTGFKVSTDAKPEIKITKNTIYLQGTSMADDGNIDMTKTGSNHYTKGYIEAIDTTLREFVDHVKNNPAYAARAGRGPTPSAKAIVLG